MIRIDCLVLLVQIALFSPNGFVASGATLLVVVAGVIAEILTEGERLPIKENSASP